ncbi:MAG: sugar-binding protein [Bacteroidales bacterium]
MSILLFWLGSSLLFFQCRNPLTTDKDRSLSMEHSSISSSDTILVMQTGNVPVIDGINNEKNWEKAPWYPLNQVWIPYGEKVDSTVFYGRYKMLWSEETNLLYFLAEITDNVFVGGHEYHPDPSMGNGYADYDILEIFIDENNEGDRHVFDAEGDDIEQWGENAESAFAYHITVDTPEDGETLFDKNALDIAGVSWSDYFIANYKNHIPEFAINRNGDLYTWELSLKVYHDSYDHQNPEKSRVVLETGKIMGVSLAYCNNDDADEYPPFRDHFFGSVEVPRENYNDHWMDSSLFGTIMLVK